MPRIDEGGPGGGPIQYPTILQTLGSDYQANWTGTTQDALKTVRYTYASASTFGKIPAAQDFASVYLAAQHIYEATLRGIKDDLTAAAEALAQAGAEIRERDEASADAFRTLQARWGTDGDGSATARQTRDATDDEPVREGSEAQVRFSESDRQPPTPGADTGGTTGAGDGSSPAGSTPSSGGAPTSTPASTSTPPSSGMDAG